MPIISVRGIINPATFVCFYEGRRARKGWDNNQFTALVSVTVPKKIPLHLLRLPLMEVAGIQIKIINKYNVEEKIKNLSKKQASVIYLG